MRSRFRNARARRIHQFKKMLVVWVQHAAVELGLSRRIRLNAIGSCPMRTAFIDEQEKLLPEGLLGN